MYYIATFYSHFGAIRFKKERPGQIENPVLMPVPRKLSSSCGTCVRFVSGPDYAFTGDEHGEIEQVVRETEQGYERIYAADDA
ncbi:DUF3343 domain-containing protein [uncultured Megasphaera sp.]|uniref:DUF3343 domain-containing protein n=1 Tax=uncultured Megasphaera sp. TaxID=165188 RepID=UPI002659FB8A|nr:DUF3343 domain-containing protein [uncultured Megasphaera sp.]